MTFKKTLIMAFAAVLTIFVVSCSDTTTGPADDTRTPGAPDSAVATSKSENSILVKWTASSDAADTAFVGYIVKITGDDQTTSTDTTTSVFIEVSGLTMGTVYTFEISSLFTNGNTSAAEVVSWSPAIRFETINGGQTIKLYETDSKNGSGVDLYDEATMQPKNLTIGYGNDWTLGLDTRENMVYFGSPTLIDYNWPTGVVPGYTEICTNKWFQTDVESLDDCFDSYALNIPSNDFEEFAVDLNALLNSVDKNIVFIIRTKEDGKDDFHYAKVLLKKQNNSWLTGSGDNEHVEIEASYQVKANVPYAKKPLK